MSDLPAIPSTRHLGKSGIIASSMAWGMWRFQGDDIAAARALVDAAFEAGITLFDTADIYGCDTPAGFGSSEALLGRVFAEDKSLRARMVLATKGGIVLGVPYDQSPAYIESAIDASLTRLGVDQIDLWQIHRPDVLAHPQETAAALEKAYAAGKIAAIGVSNFTVAQTQALAAYLTTTALPLSTTQPEYSALCLDPLTDGTFDHAMTHDHTVLAWSPLGGGRLANPVTPRDHAVTAVLDEVANAFGVSRTAAAFAWIMAHPSHPVPIVGSQNAVRIKEAADAYKITWTRASWYKVLVASRQEPLP